jgi:DNA-binding response OmpR family regulator
MRILVVENEPGLAESIARLLSEQGNYVVSHAASSSDAATRIRAGFDLVLLDWMLPDGSGIDLLKSWRESGMTVPVIFLTARAELVDKVVGLEVGANDYITKPFSPRELIARVRVQERLGSSGASRDSIRCSGIEMDLKSRRVTFQNRQIDLAHLEFELLKTFLENRDRVFSRHELLDLVWGYQSFPTTRTVDYHVSQLRQKIAPSLFETVHRVGYRFASGETQCA